MWPYRYIHNDLQPGKQIFIKVFFYFSTALEQQRRHRQPFYPGVILKEGYLHKCRYSSKKLLNRLSFSFSFKPQYFWLTYKELRYSALPESKVNHQGTYFFNSNEISHVKGNYIYLSIMLYHILFKQNVCLTLHFFFFKDYIFIKII